MIELEWCLKRITLHSFYLFKLFKYTSQLMKRNLFALRKTKVDTFYFDYFVIL